MNKILLLLLYSFVNCYSSLAQNDRQTSISTEDGIFTISQTENGKDMVLINTVLWDDMVKGTKYITAELTAPPKENICIQLSNKKYRCAAGIGFRCGIFDCNNKLNDSLVNISNRICSIKIQKPTANTIKIIFLDKVDWDSLQNDQ